MVARKLHQKVVREGTDAMTRLDKAMLDPWVIDQIRKQEQTQNEYRPGIEIPLIQPPDERQPIRQPEAEEGEQRGVCIIDLGF